MTRPPRPPAARTLTRDFLTLTKPRIISLLLVTTVAPMYVAGHPSLWLVLVLLVGGYLMAGGANAVNMYLDSDIDDRMSRTRLRPIPSGRMHPREVLVFGLILATGATFLLARYANLLTAALALLGILRLHPALHAVAQAEHAAEHRDRRRRRRHSAARRVGRRSRTDSTSWPCSCS